MSNTEIELILNNVLLVLQLALGLWQFMKLTPLGALIQGVVGWVLRRFGTYSRLRYFHGRVFKLANCFVLQPEIPSERGSIEAGSPDTLHLRYLDEELLLERRGSEGNMLFIDRKMRYYITPTIWKELQTLDTVLQNKSDDADVEAGIALFGSLIPRQRPVFLKGQREFWEEVSTGGVLNLKEVLDGLILYNQHVSVHLNDDWLLPVNLSVSEEKLLKIMNFLGLFLQIKKSNIHWLIPTSLSATSALMEFSTPLRVWLYSNINVWFCHIMHLICEPLPRSWRRQVYSLGKWVNNLKPSNDIELKIQRGNLRAIIAGGAKVDKEDATLVPWLNVADEEHNMTFDCHSIGIGCIGDSMAIGCAYFGHVNRCRIMFPRICYVTVDCKSMDEFRHIVTFVSCMAKNACGSLKSCAPNNKASVRGFRESLLSYVKNGCPPVYELELENVVLT